MMMIIIIIINMPSVMMQGLTACMSNYFCFEMQSKFYSFLLPLLQDTGIVETIYRLC